MGLLLCALPGLSGSLCRAQEAPAAKQPDMAWAQELARHPEWMSQFGESITKLLKDVKTPGPRSDSPLMEVLPTNTVLYAAFPNYGETVTQFLKNFRKEKEENPVLSKWWTSGEMAKNGPKIEKATEEFAELQQYLGQEIVLSGTFEGKEPKFLMVAEAKKPGLKTFLQQMIQEYGDRSKPGMRVLDMQELATAKEKGTAGEFTVLVRPDFVVASMDLATLRRCNERIVANKKGFPNTEFAKRMKKEYDGGVTMLGAADLQSLLAQMPPQVRQDDSFQRSGFADVKYFVWEHKTAGGKQLSESEISFNGPRHGAAAWLAKPRPLNSLDFVAPNPVMAMTIVLESFSKIFDDVKDLSGPAKAKTFEAIPTFEKMLNLDLKDDLLGLFGGEITAEVDSLDPQAPAWRVMMSVKDSEHLQKTLNTLMALGQIAPEDSEDGGVKYHVVRVPNGKATMKIGYAFVDGYLIAGSGREAVEDAVRMHRTGGSLGKSKKLAASLPPGETANASVMFYEDPIAMAMMQLSKFAPDLAETLKGKEGTIEPVALWGYGDETAMREASRNQAFDAGAVLVVAAIAIPNLLRSRIAANEASAVGSVRTMTVAQVIYSKTYPKRGFAPNLAALGIGPDRASTPTEEHAALIEEGLANPSCTGDAWCTKSGYKFKITGVCKLHHCGDYTALAVPAGSQTGTRNFCMTSDGVIRWKAGEPLEVPLSVAACKAWAPLR
jgi:type IV pilus assembly protein PilA